MYFGNMQKKSGKAAEPTAGELEFIYTRIEEGLGDSVIIEHLIDSLYEVRTSGFIKRRRKEYHAAKNVLEELLKRKVDPVFTRQQIRHWNDLAEAARNIHRNIDRVKHANGELSDNILSGSILTPVSLGPKHEESLQKVGQVVGEGLLSHLHAEFKEFGGISSWRLLKKRDIENAITREMLKQLDVVGRRRTFRGDCTICQSWYAKPNKSSVHFMDSDRS